MKDRAGVSQIAMRRAGPWFNFGRIRDDHPERRCGPDRPLAGEVAWAGTPSPRAERTAVAGTHAPAFAALVPRLRLPRARLFAVAGLAALAVPTIVTVAREHWSTPEGAQGPIVLATGGWLLWRVRDALRREAAPLQGWAWPLAVMPLALIYAFARAFGILSVETITVYLIGLLTALIHLGPALIGRFWFPFAYPALLTVPPANIIAELTQPLKIWISGASVDLLYALGYPVALAGATIQIAQYELLVQQACAGLSSMLTLCAIGLFYVHLRRNAGVTYGAALLLAIVPVAVLANLVRVLMLVLLTWYCGAAVAQGVAHDFAGLLMFFVGMLAMFAIDAALSALGGKGRRHG